MLTRRPSLIYASAALTIVAASWTARLIQAESRGAADAPFGRNGIEVCVSVSPELGGVLAPSSAAKSVQAAVESAIASPAGKALGLADVPRQVIASCPHGHVGAPEAVGEDSKLPALRGVVANPSRVSTLVFVVADSQAESLGSRGFGRVAYETLCEDGTCMEVTTALFIARSTLDSPEALELALVVGLGIDPLGGLYPDGHPPEAEITSK